MNNAQVYSWLRAMCGGKLTQDQVVAGDLIIEKLGIDTFASLIGFKLEKSIWHDISEKGYSIIREFEGFKNKAYKDTGGVWTIAFGTIKYPNGVAVKQGDSCTIEQANEWLKSDCKWVDSCLDKHISVAVSQNQFDALASLVYNIGETAFIKSTLLSRLNAGEYILAAENFDRWVFDNGKKIQGLVNRRKKEKELFLSAVD